MATAPPTIGPRRTAEGRLADEAPRVVGRGAVVALVCTALAVVALGNGLALWVTDPPWLSQDQRIVGTKHRLLREGPADVLVLGDSSAAFGVMPGVLAAEFGGRAVNLATFGRFGLAGTAWTLDEYLAHHAPPRLVVVLHGARTWWLEPSGRDLAQLPYGFGYWLRRDPRTPFPWSTVAAYAVARWVPLYTHDAAFARGLRGRGLAVPDRPAIDGDGGMLLGEEEVRWANPEAFLERTVRPELLERVRGLLPPHRAGAEALAARAARDGFDLVFVQGPHWERLVEEEAHEAVVEEVRAFLTGLTASAPRAHLLPGGPRTFARDEVENPYHLRAAAAEAYSRELAAALRALGL